MNPVSSANLSTLLIDSLLITHLAHLFMLFASFLTHSDQISQVYLVKVSYPKSTEIRSIKTGRNCSISTMQTKNKTYVGVEPDATNGFLWASPWVGAYPDWSGLQVLLSWEPPIMCHPQAFPTSSLPSNISRRTIGCGNCFPCSPPPRYLPGGHTTHISSICYIKLT